ncbi:MAG TPA: hypothetical protein DDW65_07625 [Firmicutes bacterium]|jgi:hypothetical protein|nr:hypothetical protein [Bacillota bacterium]
MAIIITDNLNAEHVISSKIDTFFSTFAISKLLKKSNFYKKAGFQCTIVLKEIFGLIYSGKNLFRTLKMNPEYVSFKKNTAYRFLNLSVYNWSRLLLLLVTAIINDIDKLTSADRVSVLIADNSLYDRSRSKKVELLSRVFDHTTHKFVKGYKMLTLGWSDETLLKFLDSTKGLPAQYLLFDSWFAFPKTIVNVVKRNLDVICMLKISSKIHYFY